jgi:flagellar biosynthesis protein FlhF
MNVQVFRGRTLKEAQRAAMQRLGPEAIIITTRTVPRTGISGLLGGADVEIAAMAPAREEAGQGPASLPPRFAPGAYASPAAKPGAPDLGALRAELKSDIRTIKQMIARSDESSLLAGELGEIRELIESMGQSAPRGDKAAARVRALGIEGPVASTISRALRGKPIDAEVMREVLARTIKSAIWPVESQRALVAVVGPSGVGKTTTAAKIAARARMEGRTVTLVACDRSRVGAIDQLTRYAELMQAELASARTADELSQILDEARTDVVVVDTSGRAPAPDGIEVALVAASSRGPRRLARARHVLLCAPASIRAIDAARVAKRYGPVSPTALAITKLDETDAPAGLLHASWAAKLPISVLCFGPRVPEDIASATSGALLDYLAPKRDGRASAA